VWNRIADVLDAATLDAMTTEVPLTEVAALASEILAGQTRGRIVVDCSR
jgi:acrylyl-CoA reductase (NADPH)